MSTTGTVHNEGADLVYEYRGEGPILLMIAGGLGDAARHRGIANRLADTYTVLAYDRRANARSTGDTTIDMDMAQQARDAVAVIRAAGGEEAFVFGNSGGAVIGLELAASHPEAVTGLVAHEPPCVTVLPDAESQLAAVDDIHRAYVAEGTAAAMALFNSGLIGFGGGGVTPRIAARKVPPHAEFLLARELRPFTGYRPDLDRIRRNRVPTVMAAGTASADAYYARTARVLADRLGCRYTEFPGNHLAFLFDAENFAPVLRDALRGLAPPPNQQP